MAKSCQATLVLAGHSETMQMKGFEFGKEIALAWQVSGCTSVFKNYIFVTLLHGVNKNAINKKNLSTL